MSQKILDMFTLEYARKLHSKDGFNERFVELTQVHETYEEAYEALEQEYKSVFGHRRYSSYESFRRVRRRKITASE